VGDCKWNPLKDWAGKVSGSNKGSVKAFPSGVQFDSEPAQQDLVKRPGHRGA